MSFPEFRPSGGGEPCPTREKADAQQMPTIDNIPPRYRGQAHAVRDAHKLGLTENHLRSRRVDHPHRGVWGIDLKTETVFERCRAYLPRMKPGDAFAHATALELHGVPTSIVTESGDLHVTSTRRTRPRVPRVIGHREKHVRVRALDGLPVTSVADAWCGLASELSLDELVILGDMLTTGVRRGRKPVPWCSANQLRAAVKQRKSARGMGRASEALELVRPGAESIQETRLRLMLQREGFADFAVGIMARDAFGNPVLCDGHPIHPDLTDVELMIATEYEGEQHRTDREQWQRDIRRIRALEAAGWIVIRVTAADLHDPRALIADLEAAYARRRRERAVATSRTR